MHAYFKFAIPFALALLSSLISVSHADAVLRKSALVIIDMQPEFITRDGHHKTSDNQLKLQTALNKQIEVMETAKQAQIPIIFIEFEGAGDTHERLLERALDYDKVALFTKNTTGMFSDANESKRDIEAYLEREQIQDLIVIGANGGACVKVSILDGLAKYNVYAYDEAIIDFNSPEFVYPYRGLYNFKQTKTTPHAFHELNSLDQVIKTMQPQNVSGYFSPRDFHCLN